MRWYRFLLIPLSALLVLTLMISPASADETVIHVVRYGQNLAQIAARYGTTVQAIMRANGLRNPNIIYVGQRLRIPVSARRPLPATGGVYVVRRGDTLSGIARRFGVSQRALMQANSLRNPNFIWVGQRLRIPGRTTASVVPTRPAPAPPSSARRVHVVARGETLSGIALRYGVSLTSLVRLNRLRSANRIYAGQRLLIPARGSSRTSSPTPAISPPTAGKWIDIDVTRQRLVAYEGSRPVFSAVVSTGVPRTPTVLGRFAIRVKLRSQRMRGPGYDLPNVPWVMYFYGAYAIHGTYWHNNFGRPMSHGCVNMRIADAQWLYAWAPVGTPVIVHR